MVLKFELLATGKPPILSRGYNRAVAGVAGGGNPNKRPLK